MKLPCFWLLVAWWTTACSITEREEVGHYPAGEVAYRVPLNAKGEYVDTLTRFYPSGVKKAELPFSNGHINGIVKRYFPTGQLMSAARYINGEQAGEVEGFYSTGELRSRGTIHGNVPSGPMRYYYRTGKMQHFNLYDEQGKIVDFAKFNPEGTIDERYTQVVVYAPQDTVRAGEDIAFEVILAGQTAKEVHVRFRGVAPELDSTKGVYSRYRYVVKRPHPGSLCVAGGVLQTRTSRTVTWFPWRHCFFVSEAK
jgi:hypothetical protein